MTTILLVRHGETEWNKIKRVMGNLHTPLNGTGNRQTKKLGNTLKDVPVSAIYSSPLKRAMETAAAINNHHNLSIIKEERLIEINFGKWIGKFFHELKDDPDYKNFYKNPGCAQIPDGEQIIDVQKRAVAAVEQVRSQNEGLVVMVSHCDIIRLILTYYIQVNIKNYRTFSIDNASLSVLLPDGDKSVVPLLNYPSDSKRIRNLIVSS